MKTFLTAAWAFALSTLAAPALSPDDPSRFTFYPLKTPLSGPCDLCNGPDGALWGENILSNIIFRLDPKTGAIEEYNIPYTSDPRPYSSLPGNETTRGAFACAIRPGADGNIYAASGVRNQLVRINPTTKEFTIFTPPSPVPGAVGNLEPFNDLYTDDEGMFFTQTTADTVTYYHYASGNFTSFHVPGTPLGTFVSHDGYAWIAQFSGQAITRLDRRTGATKTYPVPLPAALTPAVIRVETENRYIWFTALLGDAVGRLDPVTGDVKVYPNNFPAGVVSENTLSPDGRVWFSTITQNAVNYVDPKSGRVVNIKQPDTLLLAPISLPLQVEVASNYFDGAIWFTQALYNRIGRYQL